MSKDRMPLCLGNRQISPFVALLTRAGFLLLVLVGAAGFSGTAYAKAEITAGADPAAPANTAVLTNKYDSYRTGQNPNETILNTGNVNKNTFGHKLSYPVDGQVYAQPLYVPNVNVNGGTHNIVIVATENDSVYAFDADQNLQLWHASFINPPGIIPIPSGDTGCGDLSPKIGITSTPVIDPNTNILYVLAATKENGQYFQRLHAVDITTGNEVSQPATIKAKVRGHGDGSQNGHVSFDPLREGQRSGLLLLNGVVYIAWASHCDNGPYHGWVMGYNAATLQQVAVYNDSPNGSEDGIWQSGGGLAADSSGNVYFMSGNGTFDLRGGGKDAGDSFVKLSTQNGLSVSDYFAPFNQLCLEQEDGDLGSGAPLLLPSVNEVISAGKEGRIYVVSRDSMGGYHSVKNPCSKQNRTDLDRILQEFGPGTIGGLFSTPAYWNGSNGEYVYFGGVNDAVRAYKLTNGLLSNSPTSRTPESFGFTGGNPVISSNGNTSGTGILWTLDPNAILHAYDATNLGTELYNTNQNPGRDKLPSYVKFTLPVVANGEVFVGTQGSLEIYGLL
ncbi:MAG TPA: hypothetical protein VJ761_01530 [Ktedonobacteraceae bacterium]|nr:hypothetical protein [Ktedonobacteraceae bacterium]